jgi:hypothetical protein
MRRPIRPWTVFPATLQSSTFRITFGTTSYRQLAGSGTLLCAHVATPTRHETRADALQAPHLRPRWHLPRRKLGRRQYLGYIEGGS